MPILRFWLPGPVLSMSYPLTEAGAIWALQHSGNVVIEAPNAHSGDALAAEAR